MWGHESYHKQVIATAYAPVIIIPSEVRKCIGVNTAVGSKMRSCNYPRPSTLNP